MLLELLLDSFIISVVVIITSILVHIQREYFQCLIAIWSSAVRFGESDIL